MFSPSVARNVVGASAAVFDRPWLLLILQHDRGMHCFHFFHEMTRAKGIVEAEGTSHLRIISGAIQHVATTLLCA